MKRPEGLTPPPIIGERERIKMGTKIRDMLGVTKGQEPWRTHGFFQKGTSTVDLSVVNSEALGVIFTATTKQTLKRTPSRGWMIQERVYSFGENHDAPRVDTTLVELDYAGEVVETPRERAIAALSVVNHDEALDLVVADRMSDHRAGAHDFTIERADELMTFLNKFSPDDKAV